MKNIILLIITLFFLNACSSVKDVDEDAPFRGMSAQEIYDKAETALAKKKYDAAIKAFESLDSLYPFGEHSEQAQLDLIYTYYVAEDYLGAAMSADRYVHLFPRSKHVDYAYYLKGLANSNVDQGFFMRHVKLDRSLRDMTQQHQAFNDFAFLIQRFPHSPYAGDARKHMIALRNQFANAELDVAKFYLARKLYIAAINRAGELVVHYQQAPQVEEALVIMHKSYHALHMEQQAANSLSILRMNFPDAAYLKQLKA